jgi:endogenous inhibitor of DNA gyrase (YacG/DUF329 family)
VECAHCGQPVPPESPRRAYCSNTCYAVAWRARQPAEYHQKRAKVERERRRKNNPQPPAPESLPGEQWLPVLGYEGLYEVSGHGRVKAMPRSSTGRGEHLLRQHIRRHRYLSVRLYNNAGTARRMTVHRLVLEAFIGPCPAGKECCHRDGDAQNNTPSNLYWGTHTENMRDLARHKAAKKQVA